VKNTLECRLLAGQHHWDWSV